MNSPLKTLIVDDEPAARQRLRVLLTAHPEIEVVGEVGSVAEASAFVLDHAPQLVFLDMEMPGGSGLGLERHLNKATRTVFVTAYPDYALKAFQFGAVDYLLKPVDPDRLAITIERLLGGVPDIVPPGPSIIDCMGISGQIERIPLDDILWIESFQNYTRVYLANAVKPSLCRQTMAAWEALLPADLFVRTGRTEIIHSARIRAVRWNSRAETSVSFNSSTWLLQLGRASALRLKASMKSTAARRAEVSARANVSSATGSADVSSA
jgi:two-component system LytT family response regulator